MMRVQVVYGSKRGGTAGLAHMIASAFENEGWRAEVRDADERPGIGDVDIVVVGGALYMSRWPSGLVRWVRQHTPTLKAVPVWFFSSGPLDESARGGDVAPVPQVAKLARDVEISGHMTFGGFLDPHPTGWVARQMARRSAGDWRSTEQVAEWVHHICRHTTVLADVPQQRAAEPVAPAEPAAPRRRRTTAEPV